jgi:predicted homoserine dehydrogenase-like protein
MNLNSLLHARADAGIPVRVGVIGAGKFGSMFLSQALHHPGFHVVGVADLNPATAEKALLNTGWPKERITRHSAAKALDQGTTFVTDDALALIEHGGLEVVVEATGLPEIGIKHALAAFERGRHVVMVNVEADVLAGPLLAQKAAEAGVVYSMAYGDQPSLICQQVDWARTIGLEVVAAGKGTLYMPEFHESTPDTVWSHYGLTAERAKESGMNAKMFNSFLDGTKSGIEMAAVANATGLTPAPHGLDFPAVPVDALASTMIPQDAGGILHHKGQVEVVSSRERSGEDLENDLRWGVYVVFEAPTDYVKSCFSDYGMITDAGGGYSALWRPYHLIGLELGVSVAYAAILKQPTGSATKFIGDVVACAKRDLRAGEVLDGEGGFTVWGKLMPGAESVRTKAVPIGLAQKVKLKRPIKQGAIVTWDDVEQDRTDATYLFRREMETLFMPQVKAPEKAPLGSGSGPAGGKTAAQVTGQKPAQGAPQGPQQGSPQSSASGASQAAQTSGQTSGQSPGKGNAITAPGDD